MKKFLAALALAGVGATLPSAPAQAGTPGCASKREFRSIHRGDSITLVANRFDATGRVEAEGSGWRWMEYRACSSGDWNVHVYYSRRPGPNGVVALRVSSKSAYWG